MDVRLLPGLIEQGYTYGPVFQGLRAVWRRGGEVYAEVALPDGQREEAARFGIHPALLDAALHANGFVTPADATAPGDAPRTVLPFAWNRLALHAAGASALRVRVAPSGPDAVAVQAADETGEPVLTTESLVFRAVSAEQLRPRPAPPGRGCAVPRGVDRPHRARPDGQPGAGLGAGRHRSRPRRSGRRWHRAGAAGGTGRRSRRRPWSARPGCWASSRRGWSTSGSRTPGSWW